LQIRDPNQKRQRIRCPKTDNRSSWPENEGNPKQVQEEILLDQKE